MHYDRPWYILYGIPNWLFGFAIICDPFKWNESDVGNFYLIDVVIPVDLHSQIGHHWMSGLVILQYHALDKLKVAI